MSAPPSGPPQPAPHTQPHSSTHRGQQKQSYRSNKQRHRSRTSPSDSYTHRRRRQPRRRSSISSRRHRKHYSTHRIRSKQHRASPRRSRSVKRCRSGECSPSAPNITVRSRSQLGMSTLAAPPQNKWQWRRTAVSPEKKETTTTTYYGAALCTVSTDGQATGPTASQHIIHSPCQQATTNTITTQTDSHSLRSSNNLRMTSPANQSTQLPSKTCIAKHLQAAFYHHAADPPLWDNTDSGEQSFPSRFVSYERERNLVLSATRFQLPVS